MNLEESSKKVSVFLNSNINISIETVIFPHMTVSDLLQECKEKLSLEHHSKCILYDSNGGKLSDDDLEYTNPEEPLFLSLGERFSKSSNLVMYNEIKKLGQGGFGRVVLYQHKISHEKVAIKFINLKSLISPEDINRVYSEISVLRGLKHPNIVSLYQSFTLHDDICFVMDYCSGGELATYLAQYGPLPESKLYPIALQIVDAIRYCHNSKIVHRDLKLENILFTNHSYLTIKIVDFGIAGFFSVGQGGEKSNAGSLLYIPPEIYQEKSNEANPAIDIWAIGCIFYYLLTGTHPFMRKTQKEIISAIENLDYEPLNQSISRPWHKLIKGILRKDPNRRWDIIKIQQHLEKYFENENETVSEDSFEVEEEKKKEKNEKKEKKSEFLKVPDFGVHGKSQSPIRSAREDVRRLSPRPVASKKNLKQFS